MNRTRLDRRRASYRIVFGLILLPALVLLTASAVLLVHSARQAQTRTRDAYVERMEAVAAEMDGMIGEVVQTQALLETTRDLVDFFVSAEVFPLPEQYRPTAATRALSRFQESRHIIASSSILQAGWDRVLTAAGLTTFSLHLEDQRYDAYDIGFWRAELDRSGPALTMLPPTRRQFGSGITRVVMPLVLRRVGQFWSRNLFVIDLDYAWINRFLTGRLVTPGSRILVFDSADRLVMEGGLTDGRTVPLGLTAPAAGAGDLVVSLDLNTVAVIPLRYVAVVPAADILSIARAELWISLSIVAVGAAFATLSAYVVSKRVYSPIRQLVQILDTDGASPVTLHAEYDYLRERVVELLDEHREMELEVQAIIPLVFEVYLIRLLNVGSGPATVRLRELVLRHDLQFRERFFVVVVIQAGFRVRRPPARPSDIHAAEIESMDGIARLIQSVLDPVCRTHNLVLDRNRLAVVTNFADRAASERIGELIAGIPGLFSDDPRIESFVGGQGRRQEGLDGLCASYREALTALAMADPYTFGITVYDPEHVERREFIYTIEDETRIYNCLNARDLPSLWRRLQEVVECNLDRGSSPQAIRELHMQLYYTGLRVAYSRNDRPERLMGDDHVPVELLATGHYEGSAMLDYIRLFFDRIARSADLPSRSKIDLADMLKYVNSHFREPIYLETLAERFGTTDKYVSRVFKQRMSVSFYDYLTTLRVNHARTLLAQSSRRVADICTDCGFSNRNSFLRSFRKIVGMTPTQYRVTALRERTP